MKPPHIEFNKNELVSPSRDELIDYIEWLEGEVERFKQDAIKACEHYADAIGRIKNLRAALEWYGKFDGWADRSVSREALAEDDEAKGE